VSDCLVSVFTAKLNKESGMIVITASMTGHLMKTEMLGKPEFLFQ
jgi:hypothetical protein